MKIAILGAGAMGSLYGGLLAEGGNEVWLIDVWQQHVDIINQRGLSIEGISGNRIIKNIKATSNPSDAGKVDLVIIFVKSTITDTAVSANKILFQHHPMVLTLQNGLGNIEKIEKFIDRSYILAGITSHGSTMLGAGKVNHAGVGETHLGELDGSISSRVEELYQVFSSSGLKTTLSNNVLGLIWSKLMVNVGINALTAITGMKNGTLIEFQETEELLELAVAEAYKVAKATGISLSYEDPIAHTKAVCKATAANQSSMLQDVLNKRTTEIDMINGAIVREGNLLGISTPVNKVLTNLVAVLQKNF